jgi:hypothetical protein
VAGFYHAATVEGGSPLIVQISGAAGGDDWEALKGKSKEPLMDLRLGARLRRRFSGGIGEIYRPGFLALGLDHFAVPDIRKLCSQILTLSPGKHRAPLPTKSESASMRPSRPERVRHRPPRPRGYDRLRSLSLLG